MMMILYDMMFFIIGDMATGGVCDLDKDQGGRLRITGLFRRVATIIHFEQHISIYLAPATVGHNNNYRHASRTACKLQRRVENKDN